MLLHATTLLAASMIAQAQVDEDYRAKPGDRAALGYLVHGKNARNGLDRVVRADCYSALDGLRKSVEVDEDDPEPYLDPDPDSYRPRVGTSVLVIDAHRFEARGTGGAVPFRAFKVRVLEGEFKDRTFFVHDDEVIRFVQAVGEPAEPTARRRAAAPRQPATDLVLTDVASNPSATGNYVEVAGRVRNMSSKPFRLVRVTVAFEDASGRLVRTAWTFCEPKTIEPGGLGSFEVSAQSDARYAGYKLSFQDGEAAIPWVDRSGKDVHP